MKRFFSGGRFASVRVDNDQVPARGLAADHNWMSTDERRVVGLPAAASGDPAQSKTIRLRVEDFGPQPVRSAARGVLVDHRDHADEVVLIVDAVQGGATILAAAPGNGGARLASEQG